MYPLYCKNTGLVGLGQILNGHLGLALAVRYRKVDGPGTKALTKAAAKQELLAQGGVPKAVGYCLLDVVSS